MVILAVYGLSCGASPVASALTWTCAGDPGSAMPEAGDTDSQVPPATTAVYEIGPPEVVSLSVWGGIVWGGHAKFNVVVLRVSVAGASVTVSVTGTTAGPAAVPEVTFTEIVAVYLPAIIELGFTRTDKAAGIRPVSGVTVSQSVFVPPIVTA
jgi:hypothetical protein